MAEYWKPREDKRPWLSAQHWTRTDIKKSDDEVAGRVAGAEGRWLLRLVIAFARILGKSRVPSHP